MWTQMIMDGENKIAALAINNKDGEALNIIDPEVFPAILSLPSPILSLNALELNPFLCWPRLSAEERPTCLAAPGKTDKECWALWASVLALDYNLLYLVHRAHAHATKGAQRDGRLRRNEQPYTSASALARCCSASRFCLPRTSWRSAAMRACGPAVSPVHVRTVSMSSARSAGASSVAIPSIGPSA